MPLRSFKMCGILSILRSLPAVDASTAEGALGSLTHRGPDAGGIWREGGVFLGHRRLSIIDLDTGDQPMRSRDGRYVIVFNGEIYNFPELREQLIGHGAQFDTRSDTEVILEGYRRWGSEVVHRLHGMFAFLIWDRIERTAFAARDRLGIKPLCWAMRNGALIVSSTLEPFHVLVGAERRIDLTAVRDLMTFDYIPVPRTIFQGVSKLEPGSCLRWSLGAPEPTIERYWFPPIADVSKTTPDEFELEQLLEKAVQRQLISDVPIGAFLSGGIDSSLLVAMMARHSSRPVQTFSVAFSEGNVDESSIAELVARQFATNHTVLRAEEVGSEALLELIGRLDEPFCDPTFVPTYSLSEMTKNHVKVALSGDGGDEVFGGYSKYLFGENVHHQTRSSSIFHRVLTELPWRPRGMDRIYSRTLSLPQRFRYTWTRYGDFPIFRKDLRQLFNRPYQEFVAIRDYFEPWERRAKRYGTSIDTDVLMRVDLETYLSENCLVKTDRASMLASLEVRVPYLDETILDRILPLPSTCKIPNRRLKALLMPIAQRLLPKEVWNRPKHGFDVPIDVRLAGGWRQALESTLDWGERHSEVFDCSYLRRLHKINVTEGGMGRELWNPFVLLAWAKANSVSL